LLRFWGSWFVSPKESIPPLYNSLGAMDTDCLFMIEYDFHENVSFFEEYEKCILSALSLGRQAHVF
jgi:hypothetical protein